MNIWNGFIERLSDTVEDKDTIEFTVGRPVIVYHDAYKETVMGIGIVIENEWCAALFQHQNLVQMQSGCVIRVLSERLNGYRGYGKILRRAS